MGSNPILFLFTLVWRNKVDALVLGTSEIIRIGSSPITSTFFIKKIVPSSSLVRTTPFQGANGGSNPPGIRGIAQLGRALVF